MKTSDIVLQWYCESDDVQTAQLLTDIVEAGTAICEECGEDMTL